MVFRISKKKAAAALCILAPAAIAAALLWVRQEDKPALTEADARSAVESRYDGSIEKIALSGDVYTVLLRNEQGLYELHVPTDGSGIASIYRLERADADGEDGADRSPAPEAEPTAPTAGPGGGQPAGSPVSPDSSPPPSVWLTEEEAAALAAKEIEGTIEETEWGESGGKRYYLVEIDTPDDREAVVQIHAVTGEVMSVTWDDDDDEEEGDDD